jgi:damage-control phosphatase, subfamily I
VKTYLDCMVCFVRQSLEAVRRLTPDTEVHERVIREGMAEGAKVDLGVPPPVMGQTIHRVIRKAMGVDDPYLEAKRRFSRFAMEREGDLRKRLLKSGDRIGFGIRLAIAGNIIDFGVKGEIEEGEVLESIEHALGFQIEGNLIRRFEAEAQQAREILYLADNAGEIVFDKLLIEQLPMAKITLAVKEGPIINDALMAEAREAGLTSLVKVISNGTDAPGTVLDQCNKEFVDIFNRADMVISKGQGNFEMLNEVKRPIWFLLKVKCEVLAKHLNLPIGEVVFRKNGV